MGDIITIPRYTDAAPDPGTPFVIYSDPEPLAPEDLPQPRNRHERKARAALGHAWPSRVSQAVKDLGHPKGPEWNHRFWEWLKNH